MAPGATDGGKRPDSACCTTCDCQPLGWTSLILSGYPFGWGGPGQGRECLHGSQYKNGLFLSLIFSWVPIKGNEWGEGKYGKAKKTQDSSNPPNPFPRNPLKSNLQLVSAGQHRFSHRELVCHTSPVDILHDSPYHIQLLCRKDKR